MSAALRVRQRPLADTGLTIPALAFGAGPVSALMTDATARERQLATVQRSISLGVDWFDTAATYGNGASETNLGCALRELGAGNTVRVGTKVRLAAEQFGNISGAMRASVEGSLHRLGVSSVALLQLHNSITRQRGDQPTSITPDDVLRPGGVLEAFEQLRSEGLVKHFGLTGLGDAESLNEVLASNAWTTMQVNLNLCDASSLSPIGGERRGEEAGRASERNTSLLTTPPPHPNPLPRWGRGNDNARHHAPSFLAIRVFAGGALAGKPPSAHTLTTKFFPLPIYERDLRRAEAMRLLLPAEVSLPEAAVRFAVHHARVTSAIIGFGSPDEVEDAARWTANGPLPDELIATLASAGA